MDGRAWRLAVGLGAPALLLLALYVGVACFVGGHLPARTSVAGVAVGGLTAEAAQERLAEQLGHVRDEPVVLRLDTERVELTPAELGLELDPAATLEGTTGVSLLPSDVWYRLSGGGPLEPKGRVDASAAYPAIERLRARVDRDVVEPVVTFPGGTPDVTRPLAGRRLDVDRTVASLPGAWPARREVTGVVDRTEPAVSPSQADRDVEQVADRAVAGPLTLVLGRNRTAVVPVARLAPALAMHPRGGRLVLTVDPDRLSGVVARNLPEANRAPVDARVRLRAGRPVVEPARPGASLDAAATAKRAASALTSAARRAGVVVTPRPPAVSTATATSWGVRQRIGEAALPASDPDVAAVAGDGDVASANVARAAARLDGTLVRPGGELSLLDVLGDPAADGGYGVATTLDGDRPAATTGGGVSQLASALHEAAYGAGLPVLERRPHRVHLEGFTPGRDAVVAWPDVDLRVGAPEGSAVLVEAGVEAGRVRVRLWGSPVGAVRLTSSARREVTHAPDVVGDAGSCVPNPTTRPGFVVDVRRSISVSGSAPREDSDTVRYDPLPRVRCP